MILVPQVKDVGKSCWVFLTVNKDLLPESTWLWQCISRQSSNICAPTTIVCVLALICPLRFGQELSTWLTIAAQAKVWLWPFHLNSHQVQFVASNINYINSIVRCKSVLCQLFHVPCFLALACHQSTVRCWTRSILRISIYSFQQILMSNCSLCLCLSVNKPIPVQTKDVKSLLEDASKRH